MNQREEWPILSSPEHVNLFFRLFFIYFLEGCFFFKIEWI
jgi:hypothetical protein